MQGLFHSLTQGLSLSLTITMTAGSNPQWRVVCMYCWEGTIKYATMKSGVFLCTLDTLLEGYHVKTISSPKLWPSARIEHPWTTAVTPWEKRPVAPVANWSVSSRTNNLKEISVTVCTSSFRKNYYKHKWCI